MEIKRNIFESSAKMPKRYESFAVPMTETDVNTIPWSCAVKPDSSVKHARIPRVGEQK
jgi:hypothetical protein